MYVRYKIDYSNLTSSECDKLLARIDMVAYDSAYNPNKKVCAFSLKREEDYQLLNVPDKCRVQRL